jgi:lysophospholipase L1-like esterase
MQFTNDKCMELYNQSWTDRQIADYFGVNRQKITNWRHKRNLPCHYIHPTKAVQVHKAPGVSFKRALQPDKWPDMTRFLNRLLNLHDEYGAVDVDKFLVEYHRINERGVAL